MKKLFLGMALASAALVACQNPSLNTMEAGSGPEAAATCQMESSCDMESMDAGCDMEAKASSCDMEAKQAKGGCCGDEAAPATAAEPN
ncbi:MAG: hypothetical protein P1V81_10310 [Planctomycetota bacterium]|nr:hypothetical protein [Planctomycetota bacterium]